MSAATDTPLPHSLRSSVLWRLKGPLLIIAVAPRPKLDERAVCCGGAVDVEAGTGCIQMRWVQPIIAAGGRREVILLVGAVQPIPELHFRAIRCRPPADLHTTTTLHADDAVLAGPALRHCPALI